MTVTRSSGRALPDSASMSSGCGRQHLVEPENLRRREAVGVVDDGDPAERRQLAAHLEESFEEADVFDDRDRRAAVTSEVLHLLGCRGVVDRDRRRAEHQHRGVGDVELRTVAHHQHDAVAVRDAEIAQRGRASSDLLGVVGPGQLADRVTVLRPQGGGAAVGGNGLDEHLRERRHARVLALGATVFHSARWKTWGQSWKTRRHSSRGARWGPSERALSASPPRDDLIGRSCAPPPANSSSEVNRLAGPGEFTLDEDTLRDGKTSASVRLRQRGFQPRVPVSSSGGGPAWRMCAGVRESRAVGPVIVTRRRRRTRHARGRADPRAARASCTRVRSRPVMLRTPRAPPPRSTRRSSPRRPGPAPRDARPGSRTTRSAGRARHRAVRAHAARRSPPTSTPRPNDRRRCGRSRGDGVRDARSRAAVGRSRGGPQPDDPAGRLDSRLSAVSVGHAGPGAARKTRRLARKRVVQATGKDMLKAV